MRDQLPWALIYGAQNKKHCEELDALRSRCTELEGKLKDMYKMVVKSILFCSIADFNSKGHVWEKWNEAKAHLTREDILSLVEEIAEEKRRADPWFYTWEWELRSRGDMLAGLFR